jgi:transposase InsO family protein
MTTSNTLAQKAARRKLSLLELASDLDNVSKACRIMGYSREQFYEIRRNFQTFGADGLAGKIKGARSPHPNRVSEELEKAVLDYCLGFPAHGPVKASRQLILTGIHVGVGAVRGIWQRHNLLSKHQRPLRLEKHYKDNNIQLTEQHITLLEKFDPGFRERHIKADFTGQLVALDTFFVGNLKGIGKIYLQAVVGCHSRFAFGHLYASKVPVTAVRVLNEKVLPFFEERECPIVSTLTDNGREYCGRTDGHPFELFLQLEGIEHRTLLDEHFRIQGRIRFYESLEEMQTGLDTYLHVYNYERARQGRNMSGRTPRQAFVEGVPAPSLKEDSAA